MLTTTVKLPGAADYDSKMEIHTSTANKYISLAREFKKKLSDPIRSHVLLYNGNHRKSSSKRKWNDNEYNVQFSRDVSHILVKMSWETTKSLAL